MIKVYLLYYGFDKVGALQKVSRKEVFQPHLPVRLPCYDLALVTSLTLNSALRQNVFTAPLLMRDY